MSGRRERGGRGGRTAGARPTSPGGERKGLTTPEQKWLLEQMATKRRQNVTGARGPVAGPSAPEPEAPVAVSKPVQPRRIAPEVPAIANRGAAEASTPAHFVAGQGAEREAARPPPEGPVVESFWRFG